MVRAAQPNILFLFYKKIISKIIKLSHFYPFFSLANTQAPEVPKDRQMCRPKLSHKFCWMQSISHPNIYSIKMEEKQTELVRRSVCRLNTINERPLGYYNIKRPDYVLPGLRVEKFSLFLVELKVSLRIFNWTKLTTFKRNDTKRPNSRITKFSGLKKVTWKVFGATAIENKLAGFNGNIRRTSNLNQEIEIILHSRST